MSIAEDQSASIGHNFDPLDPEAIRARLADKHGALLTRASSLTEAAARLPEKIEDDETNAKMGDFVKQIGGAHKALEAARKTEKAPYDDAGKVVHGFFTGPQGKLEEVKRTAEARMSGYMRAKADAERKRREEEARRLAEEAAAKNDESAFEQASGEVEMIEASKPAEMVRQHSDLGTVATLRTSWEFEVLDRAKVDLEALRPYLGADAVDKAIRAAIRAGVREIGGVRIYQDQKASIR